MKRTGDQVRRELDESGKVPDPRHCTGQCCGASEQFAGCGGSDSKLARQLGADLYITGTVQKVSNLILNVNVYLHDAQSGRLITAASADMRGNTDESWSRATRYLVKERLLAPNFGAPSAR